MTDKPKPGTFWLTIETGEPPEESTVPSEGLARQPWFAYRYDMIGANKAGEHRHPQLVIRKVAPMACDFEPSSMGDCWFFSSPKIAELPPYIDELRPGRWSWEHGQ